jgi:hypothetical protein
LQAIPRCLGRAAGGEGGVKERRSKRSGSCLTAKKVEAEKWPAGGFPGAEGAMGRPFA